MLRALDSSTHRIIKVGKDHQDNQVPTLNIQTQAAPVDHGRSMPSTYTAFRKFPSKQEGRKEARRSKMALRVHMC